MKHTMLIQVLCSKFWGLDQGDLRSDQGGIRSNQGDLRSDSQGDHRWWLVEGCFLSEEGAMLDLRVGALHVL